jgi:hypothetical protein
MISAAQRLYAAISATDWVPLAYDLRRCGVSTLWLAIRGARPKARSSVCGAPRLCP